MEQIRDDATVCARPEHVSVDLDAGAVVLDTVQGVYFGIDGVGARIWELLASPRTVGEIVQTIVGEYEVDADRCREDLAKFLTELEAQGLIEVT